MKQGLYHAFRDRVAVQVEKSLHEVVAKAILNVC